MPGRRGWSLVEVMVALVVLAAAASVAASAVLPLARALGEGRRTHARVVAAAQRHAVLVQQVAAAGGSCGALGDGTSPDGLVAWTVRPGVRHRLVLIAAGDAPGAARRDTFAHAVRCD